MRLQTPCGPHPLHRVLGHPDPPRHRPARPVRLPVRRGICCLLNDLVDLVLLPNTSWITTTPGHGPGPLGSETYACTGPFAVGIAISVIADQHSLPWWGRVGSDDQCSAQRYRYQRCCRTRPTWDGYPRDRRLRTTPLPHLARTWPNPGKGIWPARPPPSPD